MTEPPMTLRQTLAWWHTLSLSERDMYTSYKVRGGWRKRRSSPLHRIARVRARKSRP